MDLLCLKREYKKISTVSGPSLMIRFSKLLASLVANSSSVSSIAHHSLVSIVYKVIAHIKNGIRYKGTTVPGRWKRQ